MPTTQHESRGTRGTRALAARLGAELAGGAVIALRGDLGAGKTTFVQGLAKGLGVPDLTQVLSPTYTLVNEYPGGRLTLVHIDLYRVKNVDAALALGLDEQIGQPAAITAIEWADLMPELIPASAIWVTLHHHGANKRNLELTRG